MIKRIGVDIIKNNRIKSIYEKHGESFLLRILTKKERSMFFERKESISFLAGRWAAKEAVGKALGVGLKCGISNIEVLNDLNGVPYVTLHEDAKIQAKLLGIERIELSISHEKEYSVAFVVTL